MKILYAIIIVLLIISCTQQNSRSRIIQEKEQLENSLIEFKSLDGILQPDSIQLSDPKTLIERMEHYNVPGVSLAIIKNNQIEWTMGYGVQDVNTGDSVTSETIFEAASTSKFITSIIVLYYVQKGLLDLDKNVNEYLELWKVPENEYTKEEKVTLRRLLSHQAGMPETDFDVNKEDGYPTLINILNGESPAINKPAIPEFIPGTKWQYSNVSYVLIQFLLEDLTGKTYQQIAEEIIFSPLEMRNSFFIYPLNSDKKKQEAMPHDAYGVSHKPAMHLTAFAHGGLMTTPVDLAKFAQEVMLSYHGKSNKILSKKMIDQIFSKECEVDPNRIPFPFYEGLGVFLMNDGKDLLFTHPGSNLPGLNCWLIGWPEHETAIIIMTNGKNGEILTMEIISGFNNLYNKKQVTP